MQVYSDPDREADSYALPDVEVFYIDEATAPDFGIDDNGDLLKTGWYYWFCFPGCLPDSEPYGPFDNSNAAELAAQEDNN